MVYDVTGSDLNETVWEFWFLIPTVVSHLRSVVAITYISDCDVGEIFINFMLESKLRPYVRDDLNENKLRFFQFGITVISVLEISCEQIHNFVIRSLDVNKLCFFKLF